ncbi:HEAT repeat domain-containing protein [Elusimicrobiota bacterium]
MLKRICLVLFCFFIVGVANSFAVSEEAQSAIDVLKSTSTAERRRAAAELARLRSRESVPALIEALKDKDFGVRAGAAEALGNLRDRRAVEPLIKKLKDKDLTVRTSALIALGFIRDINAVKPVVEVLRKDDNISVKISAAQVLGVLGHNSSVKPLINILSDKDERLRAQAARSLGKLRADSAAGPLSKIAGNKKAEIKVRKAAIEALGEIKTAESLEILGNLIESDNEDIAVNAAASLGKLGEDGGIDVAIKGIDSEYTEIRRQAVLALSYIGIKDERVVEALRKAVNDDDPRVKRVAEFVVNSMKIDLSEGEDE